jgi:DNA-binding NtrC family response regulator
MREEDKGMTSPIEPTLEFVRPQSPEVDAPVHTIHLLDHDSDVLLFLFDFLSNAGFQVSASSNAGDAFQYVAREHPRILIAGMELAEMTGLELLQRVRELSPSTRVVLTSIRADWSAYEDVFRNGGAELVARPIKGMTLLRAVERVLAL